jgi:hypothetical protein
MVAACAEHARVSAIDGRRGPVRRHIDECVEGQRETRPRQGERARRRKVKVISRGNAERCRERGENAEGQRATVHAIPLAHASCSGEWSGVVCRIQSRSRMLLGRSAARGMGGCRMPPSVRNDAGTRLSMSRFGAPIATRVPGSVRGICIGGTA